MDYDNPVVSVQFFALASVLCGDIVRACDFKSFADVVHMIYQLSVFFPDVRESQQS